MGEMAPSPAEPLPLGFRFHPTEEELVSHYLRRKITGQIRPEIEVIPEIDIYKYEPWELPDKSLIRSEDPEWFFFSQKDRKYPNGHRSNRATKAGYWKATGRDRIIRSKTPPASTAIGMKKILVFHQGRAPKGVHTNWIMHEYRASEPEFGLNEQGGYVLYRLFRKVAEKNVYCNREETERTGFSPNLAMLSPGDTQPEGDEFEELVATIMEKPINQVSLVSDLQEEQKSLLDTVENQSTSIIGWPAEKQDCDLLKVKDSHCNNHTFSDVKGNHEAIGGGPTADRFLSVSKSSSLFRTTTAAAAAAAAAAAEIKPPSNITRADPILDAVTTSGDTLAPILSAAQDLTGAAQELTCNQIPLPEASVAYTTETSGEDSSTLSRIDNSSLSTDPNLCHDTAIDGSHASCKVEETDEPQPSRSALANHPQHKFEGKATVLSPEVLPLGFRFHPTDEELVKYLKKKIKSRRSEIRVIPEIDVCKCEPWELPYISPLGSGASEWFFFSSKDRKYPTGNRSNRATRAGYWKVSGKDRIVRSKAPTPPRVIGTKKSLIFYRGRAPKGVHTYWVMHEYTATEPEFEIGDQGGFVLYRLFRKIDGKYQICNEHEIDGKYQICNEHEVDRSCLSSSPTKSSPGDIEHEGDSLEELDAPINQTSPVSDSQEPQPLLNLHEEQKSFAKTVENRASVVTLADKADCSFIKPEGSFSNGHAAVAIEGDYEVKPGGSFVSRCLSSLFTSSATRRSRQIIEFGSFLDANTKLRDNTAPITLADISKVPADHIPASVSQMAENSDTMLRMGTHPMNIDPSSCLIEDNDGTRHSSSTLSGQMQERSDNDLNVQLTSIVTQAASCNALPSSSLSSTDSSDISSHLMLLRSLFSKSLSELTFEQFKEGAEAGKIVSSSSGMHRDLAEHLQSVIDQACALRVHLDRQSHIIRANTEPVDRLERLESDMTRFADRLEAITLEIDQTAALVLQRRLQSKGSGENLTELREEQARLSSVVASMEQQMSKLRGEKSRRDITIGLAVDFIEKLEAEFAALAEPFRDYFVPAK